MKRVAEPIGSEMNAFDVISLTTEAPRQNRVTPEGEPGANHYGYDAYSGLKAKK